MTTLTVCVPAYNAAGFVAETIASIAAQRFRDFRILVSLDRSRDESEAVLRRCLPRGSELVVQPSQLGWVANVNALIARVDTPFFCIVPHDDLLDPRYLAEVHALAASDAGIACAYSDIAGFGARRLRVEQADIRGTRLQRVTDFLLHHFGAVAFRGVVRRAGPNDRPFIPTGLRSDYAADTVWMLRLAQRGELRRLPEPLYSKRYGERTVHAEWSRWSREELCTLWAEQAAACALMALEGVEDSDDRDIILAAAMMRLVGVGRAAPGYPAPRSPLEVAAATAVFCTALGAIRPPRDLERVLAHPRAGMLRAAQAEAAVRDAHYSLPRRLWWELLYRLRH
jgi:glycosyltransferase involved in cell wall biosynthesis